MIPNIPEVSVFAIPLDVAGSTMLRQRVGYVHLWQFENIADGSISLDGAVDVVFGGQSTQDDALPMGYNSRVQISSPVDALTIRWAAQPGIRARFLVGPDARAMEANNIPAKQLVVSSGSTAVATSSATVGVAAAQILAASSTRARAVIQAPTTNTADVVLGVSGVTMASGIILTPGAAFEWRATAAVFAIAGAAAQGVRIYTEAA